MEMEKKITAAFLRLALIDFKHIPWQDSFFLWILHILFDISKPFQTLLCCGYNLLQGWTWQEHKWYVDNISPLVKQTTSCLQRVW